MIESNAASAFDALASQLEQQAAAIAQAAARSALLARVDDPSRWRRPELLWPLATKEFARWK